MRYLELDGRRLSRVGLGCWQFGEKGWGYGRDYGPEESVAIVHRALELGVTVLDTAELYGRGASESLLGEALEGRQEEVFLATKFLPVVPLPGIMETHLRRSLERLRQPRVDLYQLHFPNPVVPLGIQMEGLRRLLGEGLTRYPGVSRFSLSRWRRAERILGKPIVSNQVLYNVLQRGPEAELLQWAQDHGRIVVAFSPLAQGAVSGKYGPDRQPQGVRRTNSLFSEGALTAAAPVVEVLREIAAGRSATPSQIALAYLLAHPRVVAIPGANSVAQLESNVAAADIELGADELLAIRRAADLFFYSRLRAVGETMVRLARPDA